MGITSQAGNCLAARCFGAETPSKTSMWEGLPSCKLAKVQATHVVHVFRASSPGGTCTRMKQLEHRTFCCGGVSGLRPQSPGDEGEGEGRREKEKEKEFDSIRDHHLGPTGCAGMHRTIGNVLMPPCSQVSVAHARIVSTSFESNQQDPSA